MQNEEEKQETTKEYMVDVMINPECLDEDGADCPCYRKEVVPKYNPV